jgi:hypothetical protein
MDVPTRDVGNEPLVTTRLAVKDNAGLAAMRGAAVLLGAEDEPEFERHVEPRQRSLSVNFRSRNVMNALTAFIYDTADFSNRSSAASSVAQRATSPERTIVKTAALKRALQPSSKGQLMKTSRAHPPFSPVWFELRQAGVYWRFFGLAELSTEFARL